MFNDEELENIQIAIGVVLDTWALTPEGIEKFKALEVKVLALRETHLTQDAADGAMGSAKNDLFDVEWVDDKTIRLRPHR